MRFLSFGAGVQTTALLLIDTFDEVIFADAQGEKDPTYDYMEKYTKPYCEEKGMRFTVVQRKESLEQFCLRTHMCLP